MTTQTNDTPFDYGYKSSDYVAVDIQPLGTYQLYQWIRLENCEEWQLNFRSVYGDFVSLAYTITMWNVSEEGLIELGLDPAKMQDIGYSYSGNTPGVPSEL